MILQHRGTHYHSVSSIPCSGSKSNVALHCAVMLIQAAHNMLQLAHVGVCKLAEARLTSLGNQTTSWTAPGSHANKQQATALIKQGCGAKCMKQHQDVVAGSPLCSTVSGSPGGRRACMLQIGWLLFILAIEPHNADVKHLRFSFVTRL